MADIQTRATLIRTADGRRVVIPNGTLFTQSVTVNTAFPARRCDHELTVKASAEVETLRSDMLQALRASPGVLAAPASEVLLVDTTDDRVRLRVRWWIEPTAVADDIASRDRVLAALRHAVAKAGGAR